MDAAALAEALDALPTSPGVYVFSDAKGNVLYVGKARSLRSRVRSYFQAGSSDVRFFIERLERELGSIRTIVTATEKEAALLENQVIKEERPRYNVKLRDDKEYLSLKLDPKANYPRLEVVRRPRRDGASYFGPYPSATSARHTLRVVNRHFQLRTCTDTEFAARVRPCLQHQIGRCPAPCVLDVDRTLYAESVRDVSLFLSGRHDELRDALTERMREAAKAFEYERAAKHRDQLRALETVAEPQRVAAVRDIDQDAIGIHRQADQAEIAVLHVRDGRLVRVRTFSLKDVGLPEDELLASFVLDYYGSGAEIPDEILLPVAIEAIEGVAALLGEERGKKTDVKVPQRGALVRIVEMAKENAVHAFEEKRRAREDIDARLERVREKLRLPRLPRRIECVDISHSGGTDTVAVFVALVDGAPLKSGYRSFRVKTVSGGDDYGAMREVLARRLARGKRGEAAFVLPDLLVVDGGRGQLRMAVESMSELGIDDLPVCALAKEKENVDGDLLVERVYLPGQKNPIPLESTPALRMLALARDEAHRASNALRKKVGTKRGFTSTLDGVPGLGKKTKTLLLTAFGSVKGIANATEDALVSAGVRRGLAQAIRAHLGADVGSDEGGDRVEDAERDALENAFTPVEEDVGDALQRALTIDVEREKLLE